MLILGSNFPGRSIWETTNLCFSCTSTFFSFSFSLPCSKKSIINWVTLSYKDCNESNCFYFNTELYTHLDLKMFDTSYFKGCQRKQKRKKLEGHVRVNTSSPGMVLCNLHRCLYLKGQGKEVPTKGNIELVYDLSL